MTKKTAKRAPTKKAAKKAVKKSAAPAKKAAKKMPAKKTTAKRTAVKKTARKATGSSSRQLSKTTTDHDEIRKWAEARGAHPASVKNTGNQQNETGLIRLDFPGYSGGESLEEISWEEFFEAFDNNGLALVYQEKTADGKRSNFNKLVSREE